MDARRRPRQHSRPRPVTLALVVTAGLVTTAAVGGRDLLRRQAATAREVIGKPLGEDALAADRTWKRKYGDPVDLLVLGDSIAAGLGADTPRQTLGGRLARRLARETGRAVRLRTAAVVGAESSALAGQLAGLPPSYAPDVAVVVVGGNDVTHRVPVAESVAHLADCVRTLQSRGTPVVVGTCPDLGALTAVPQPLRALGSRASRQLAAAQARAVEPLGAHVVSLAATVGPFFADNPEEMFSLDRFHPSSLGYKRTAQALLPHVEAALRGERLGTGPGRRLHSLGASAKNAVGTLPVRVTRTAPLPGPSKSRSEGAGGKGPPGQPGPSVAGDDAASNS